MYMGLLGSNVSVISWILWSIIIDESKQSSYVSVDNAKTYLSTIIQLTTPRYCLKYREQSYLGQPPHVSLFQLIGRYFLSSRHQLMCCTKLYRRFGICHDLAITDFVLQVTVIGYQFWRNASDDFLKFLRLWSISVMLPLARGKRPKRPQSVFTLGATIQWYELSRW